MANCDRCRFIGICKFEEKARAYETALNDWTHENFADNPKCVVPLVKCEKFHFKYEQNFLIKKPVEAE